MRIDRDSGAQSATKRRCCDTAYGVACTTTARLARVGEGSIEPTATNGAHEDVHIAWVHGHFRAQELRSTDSAQTPAENGKGNIRTVSDDTATLGYMGSATHGVDWTTAARLARALGTRATVSLNATAPPFVQRRAAGSLGITTSHCDTRQREDDSAAVRPAPSRGISTNHGQAAVLQESKRGSATRRSPSRGWTTYQVRHDDDGKAICEGGRHCVRR
ncbi:hypothetical protein BJ912DRAFT_617005 [Pholiota molesta]|nr:hypothetical protein BJ912DRAFT_617005 [Pholiota molesta]